MAKLRLMVHTADALQRSILDAGGRAEPEEFSSHVENLGQILSTERSDQVLDIPDLPEEALDTRLGDICRRRLGDFPLAYSWLSILAAASVRIPTMPNTDRTNIFVAIVGDKGSGKSQAGDRAISMTNLVGDSRLEKSMAGSIEGLTEKIGDAKGEPRLLAPDELGHMLTKARIDNATYSFVLNRSFYTTDFELILARGKKVRFNCSLSILGGLVDESFDEHFGAVTTAGLYDRFCFGVCPTGFRYAYRPLQGPTESCDPCPVRVSDAVWEVRDSWLRSIPDLTPRCSELAIRAATIAAAFDGRSLLEPKYLWPAYAFAEYQTRVRKLLRPNPGRNPDAQCGHAVLAALGSATNWQKLRDVARKIHYEKFGAAVFDRTVRSLEAIGEILVDRRRPARVRRLRCGLTLH